MKVLMLLLCLLACGDNLAPPNHIRDGAGQSASSAVVAEGTYTPVIENDRIGWMLSGDGVAYLELHVRRLDELAAIRITAKTASEPTLEIVDQVDNERALLSYTSDGSLRDLGLVVLQLDEKLTIGSSGEFVWIKARATGGEPVTFFSLDWGP